MERQDHKHRREHLRTIVLMSRYMNSAYAYFSFACVALDDMVLEELSGTRTGTEAVRGSMSLSYQSAEKLVETALELEAQMREKGHLGITMTHEIDFDVIRMPIVEAEIVDGDAMYVVMQNFCDNGFYSAISIIQNFSEEIMRLTNSLLYQLDVLAEAMSNASVIDIIEENGEGNFKPELGRLHTAWDVFRTFFVAFEMMSLEIHYASIEHGSLTDRPPRTEAA